MELQKQKLERQQQVLQDQQNRQNMLAMQREQVNSAVSHNKRVAQMKTMQTALDTKTEKQMMREAIQYNKQEAEVKASQLKQKIRYQQQSAQSRRQQDLVEKQNRTRSQLQHKMQREMNEQAAYEAEVARMEQEELELINRLKNTKLVEEQTH